VLIGVSLALPHDDIVNSVDTPILENPFFWMRVGLGLCFPALLVWMAYDSSGVRAMQSATGLLYIAMALVLSGEVVGKGLMFVSGVPLGNVGRSPHYATRRRDAEGSKETRTLKVGDEAPDFELQDGRDSRSNSAITRQERRAQPTLPRSPASAANRCPRPEQKSMFGDDTVVVGISVDASAAVTPSNSRWASSSAPQRLLYGAVAENTNSCPSVSPARRHRHRQGRQVATQRQSILGCRIALRHRARQGPVTRNRVGAKVAKGFIMAIDFGWFLPAWAIPRSSARP
jgi:hypothetical protein